MEEGPLRRRVRGAAVTELYFRDGWQCVVEATAAGGVTKEYVYGEGIDEVLKARLPDAADLDSDSNTPEKVDLYYHQNSLGSVVAVTDAAGDLVESYRYSPYGEVSITDGAGSPLAATAVEQPFMFTGRRLDFEEESGRYYYRLRYYDPAVGRFVQRDPLGMWGDPAQLGNAQCYCANDAVNCTGPRGAAVDILGRCQHVFVVAGEIRWRLGEGQPVAWDESRLGAAPIVLDWGPGAGQVVVDLSEMISQRLGAEFVRLWVNEFGVSLFFRGLPVLTLSAAWRTDLSRDMVFAAEELE